MKRTKKKSLEVALSEAIQNGEVGYAIQPILDARNGSLVAGEALARRRQNGRACIAANDFLPELCRLEWREPYQSLLLEQKLRAAECLRKQSKVDAYFNFVVESLLDDQCWESIQGNAVKNVAFFNNIVIELSEMNLFEHKKAQLDKASARLQELQMLAPRIRFALDDFGSNLSNLNRLRMWNISAIKLDRLLITDIDQDRKAQIMVKNLQKMACDLDILLIAEGVETRAEEEALLDLEIFLQQGFLRAPPMSLDVFNSTNFAKHPQEIIDAR